MDSHMPVVSYCNQVNTDGQPVVTKHQAENWTKKKEQLGARATLCDVLDDMEQKINVAASKSGDSEWRATLGTKMHKAFMAEIGEEMCQAGVAHHANKCLEYFCTRPVKQCFRKKLKAIYHQ